jgi:predicted dehydrogenase
MRQILQSLRDGETLLVDVPCPAVRSGHLLLETRRTLISAGTERMLQEFGKAGWLGKARQQPEKVRQVLDKIRTDGLFTTLEAVLDKLDEPIPLGYCHVGTVVAVGAGVTGFQVGDRVLSNGPHAEVVCVPQNLCARIPDAVSDDIAAFGVLGAIALQGIRLLQPTLGECVLVSGLGLIGLMAVQLLRAHGARVIGADFNPQRLRLAKEFGAETVHLAEHDLNQACQVFSRGRGIDAVLITAATKSHEPVHQAATVCRKRGRIVLTGVAGLQLSRDDFYKKELSFQVSCSYGPGRYDSSYEEQGHDYPAAYVRWTEQRNFEAVLDMMAQRQLTVQPLISHRFDMAQATQAYGLIGSAQPSLGVLLDYATSKNSSAESQGVDDARYRSTIPLTVAAAESVGRPGVKSPRPLSGDLPVVAFIGAGGFATRQLLPAFQQAGARLACIASRGGVSAISAAKRFKAERATTDLDAIWEDATINTVVIATRHDTHAALVTQALSAGKHVFVEKPLALSRPELSALQRHRSSCQQTGRDPLVMVGFNRRFAPQVQTMHRLMRAVAEPKSLVMTVNAGAIPADHWTQHPQQGGGRMIGEGCHFVDLLRFLVGQPIVMAQAVQLTSRTAGFLGDDKFTATLQFADGSVGTIHYLANGHRTYPKERLEVFAAGRILQLDNFRSLTGFGWPGFRRQSLWKQDKGHKAEVAAFLEAIRLGNPSPIDWTELVEVSAVSCDLADLSRDGGCQRYSAPGVCHRPEPSPNEHTQRDRKAA